MAALLAKPTNVYRVVRVHAISLKYGDISWRRRMVIYVLVKLHKFLVVYLLVCSQLF
jgi:hypothetical protein